MTTDEIGRSVVIGVDIGTTSTKAVAFDRTGGICGSAMAGYPLLEPAPGYAEQEPLRILEAAIAAMGDCARDVAADGRKIAAWSFSGAMHALVGIGSDGRALTPLVTWADTRARQQAARLRSEPAAIAVYRRTGTPIHPMSPLVKLVWYREVEPQLFAQVRRWVGVKEFVLHGLCGEWIIDHSVASATGLFNLLERRWDEGALACAGIDAGTLSRLVPVDYASLRLRPSIADAIGVAVDIPLVVGGADGPLANLGVGALRPGVAACSMGTSGAFRVTVDRPVIDEAGQLFCYVLDEANWVVGGATNNAGAALAWVAEMLAPHVDAQASDVTALELAALAPPGSGGLVMLSYLFGERAPAWDPFASGAYVGLTRAHRREHLIRAAFEGVCQQLALVAESLDGVEISLNEVRATGGLTRSPFVRQLLADVLGRPVGFPVGHEGSAYGAALIGMRSIGVIGDLYEVVDAIVGGPEVVHDATNSALYRELRSIHRATYAALAPSMRTLQGIEASTAQPGADHLVRVPPSGSGSS